MLRSAADSQADHQRFVERVAASEIVWALKGESGLGWCESNRDPAQSVLREAGCLTIKEIDCDQSKVVLECLASSRPLRKTGQKGVGESVRRKVGALFHELDQPLLAKELAGGVGRLHDTVGVEYESVSGLEGQLRFGVDRFGQEAHEHAFDTYLTNRATGLTPHQEGRMTRGGVANQTYLQVDIDAGGGYELPFDLPAENAVDLGEHFMRARGTLHLCGESYFHHRGNKSGGNSMPRNVRNQKVQALAVHHEEVVEVSRYRIHRNVLDR